MHHGRAGVSSLLESEAPSQSPAEGLFDSLHVLCLCREREILGQGGRCQALIDSVYPVTLPLRGGCHIPREPSGERQIPDGNSERGREARDSKNRRADWPSLQETQMALGG